MPMFAAQSNSLHCISFESMSSKVNGELFIHDHVAYTNS
jgi:hypothetical protein